MLNIKTIMKDEDIREFRGKLVSVIVTNLKITMNSVHWSNDLKLASMTVSKETLRAIDDQTISP